MAAFSAVAWRHCASVPHRRRSRWFPGQNDRLTLDDSMPVAVSLHEYGREKTTASYSHRAGEVLSTHQAAAKSVKSETFFALGYSRPLDY